ncbi:TPA: mRNA surveillance protein pelota [Candidatus Bathyarchaeota archaeon]|nr:mRNA surveillance protein pelota [Candidatus Bathyarchaeota archaeon]
MKIVRRDLKHGNLKVIPEILDDLWVLYNVISKGDLVYARTQREIRLGERYEKPEKGKRVSVYMGIRVEKVLWDRILNRLRVHGVIVEAPEKFAATGSHHTIKVELGKPITIIKDRWPEYQVERIARAEKADISPLTIISIDDEGYCVAVLRHFGLDVKVEERTSLPGKSRADRRAEALRSLFSSACKALRTVWEEKKTPIAIIGLGFLKNDFMRYLRKEDPDLASGVIDVKGVNSSGVSGIHEALRSGVLRNALKDLRIAEESEAVEEVLNRIGRDRNDVAYGLANVERAIQFGAVDRLLLTDEQLRNVTDEERRRIEKLMREVEKRKGRVILISTEHEAGLKLRSLGGIAALLRFPV